MNQAKEITLNLDIESLEKAQLLAKLEGIPFNVFLTQLLNEDLERLWKVYDSVKDGKP